MARAFHATATDDLGAVTWVKSRRSNSTGNCVELARVGGRVVIRDSKDPQSPALLFGRADVAEPVAGFKAGDYDNVLTGG